jgi:hypothetical protein
MASVRLRGGQGRLSAESTAPALAPTVAPRRESGVVPPPPAQPRTLAWRAIVHAGDHSATTEWHLTSCRAPADPVAHCAEGKRLIESAGEPDGHCLARGRCPRCAAQRRLARAQHRPAA